MISDRGLGACMSANSKAVLYREILKLVCENQTEYYDDLIQDKGWDFFYHLSLLRTAVLNWYDFSKDGNVLEVGSGCGAVTGLLCDRFQRVDAVDKSSVCTEILKKRFSGRKNLNIFTEQIENFASEVKYDYIVAVDFIEDFEGDLETLIIQLRRLLTEEGVLLISARNKYGLKYLCGALDENIKVPFDTINGYTKYYSKSDLEKYLSHSNFSKIKFYYPLPDHSFAQAVYTDEYLPVGSIRDRVVSYYPNQSTLIMLEDNLYDEIVNTGTLPFFSNSYLVECSMGEISDTLYVALSTDRGREHGFATVIYKDGIVKKMSLHESGLASITRMANNLLSLSKRGICVVGQKIENNAIVMPYIKKPTLVNYLKEVVSRDKEEFLKIFDQLYGDILMSSEYVESDERMLEYWRVDKEVLGPVLSKAYIDMIPYNCFYDSAGFVYYDQEFVKEKFPAKYVLFRALRYSYFYIQEAEKTVPLKEMKDKYQLNELWDKFERVEADFVEENRNYDLLKQFYQWANVDKNEINKNCRCLLEKQILEESQETGEDIDESKELFDSVRLEEIQEAQMKLLKKYDSICKKYGLNYCAIYGTLLGAIRHQGFIPWDDDIDLAMPREDYDRLRKMASKIVSPPYYFQALESDSSNFFGGYGKFCIDDLSSEEKERIAIDIFPLDQLPDNLLKAERQYRRIRTCQRIILAKIYPERLGRLQNVNPEKVSIYFWLSKILSLRYLYSRLEKLFKACRRSNKLAVLSRYYDEEAKLQIFDRKDFEYLIEVPFEDMAIPVPVGYRHWLMENVGLDYRIYPPKEERIPHHMQLKKGGSYEKV